MENTSLLKNSRIIERYDILNYQLLTYYDIYRHNSIYINETPIIKIDYKQYLIDYKIQFKKILSQIHDFKKYAINICNNNNDVQNLINKILNDNYCIFTYWKIYKLYKIQKFINNYVKKKYKCRPVKIGQTWSKGV